jgi:amino acid transporter
MAVNGKSTTASLGFGTFGGVFVPNVLTILGVILFLRAGWVVGNAGLLGSLLILVIANTLSFLTALSLSAISTNTRVGAGGAYFLVSRSLGLEIGGSIGVPLFFAQAISVAFYLVGFTESLQFLFPEVNSRLLATAALGAFVLLSWLGTGFVVKAQYLILACLGLSLASFFAGYTPVAFPEANLRPAFLEGQTFWTVFAIFFPAVTGIMSGVSMSGDLRDPSRNIPRGTILAVLVTFAVYAAQLVWLALNADRAELVGDTLVMRRISQVPALVFLGLWAATLSSALASLAAAPRTLQALGHDAVVPRVFARGHRVTREPRVALFLSAAIAEVCILVGDLDFIAPIITMFFLATYGMVNLVAGLERLVSNPSYRPTFRVHWAPSLLGAVGCAFVMFLINPVATLSAFVVIAGIYSILIRKRSHAAWGDMWSGFWFAFTRFALLRFETSRQHVRNWRPVILVLAGNPKERLQLVRFANWFEAGRGLLFLAQIVTGEWGKLLPRQTARNQALQTFIRDNALSAVGKTVVADDFEQGVVTLLQVAGLGQFQPNTVMVGWSEDAVRQAVFARAVRKILELERNLIVYAEAESDEPLEPYIDVWWYAKDNGSLMLTLAHLLKSNVRWRDRRIRVLRIIQDEAGVADAEGGTREMIAGFRIETEVRVVVSAEPPLDVIARVSRRSEVCFAGVAVASMTESESPLAAYAPLVASLRGHVFLTKSWHDLRF